MVVSRRACCVAKFFNMESIIALLIIISYILDQIFLDIICYILIHFLCTFAYNLLIISCPGLQKLLLHCFGINKNCLIHSKVFLMSHPSEMERKGNKSSKCSDVRVAGIL